MTTQLRELHDPATRLFDAVQRYTDALHVATAQLAGPQAVAELDQADRYIPGLTDEPAWPTLRAHLLTLAVETGDHPLQHLHTGAAGRDLTTAGDKAAVLDWRLTPFKPASTGPLPWLPAIPALLKTNPVWGDYLTKRAQLVADLADQVRQHANQGTSPLAWAPSGSHLSASLVGEVTVWRSANGIDPQDPLPTGAQRAETAFDLWKQCLDREVARSTDPPQDARLSSQPAGRREPSRSHDGQRPHQTPECRHSQPSAPAG